MVFFFNSLKIKKIILNTDSRLNRTIILILSEGSIFSRIFKRVKVKDHYITSKRAEKKSKKRVKCFQEFIFLFSIFLYTFLKIWINIKYFLYFVLLSACYFLFYINAMSKIPWVSGFDIRFKVVITRKIWFKKFEQVAEIFWNWWNLIT